LVAPDAVVSFLSWNRITVFVPIFMTTTAVPSASETESVETIGSVAPDLHLHLALPFAAFRLQRHVARADSRLPSPIAAHRPHQLGI